MKLAAARIPALLRDPAGIDAALVYGEDAGLVRERAEALVHAVLGPAPDPFRLTELSEDAPKRLTEEMTARSLTGGRRVVRIRAATPALVDAAERALRGPVEALLVLEAGALDKRSRLRLWAEAAPRVAPIPCYPDEGAGLAATIRDGLAAGKVAVDADALAFLSSRLGTDRGVTRQEVGKLALLAGPGGTLSLADAQAALGESGVLSLEEALTAALAGDPVAADRAMDAAVADGTGPVAIVRGAIRSLQRLDQAAALVAGGASAEQAAETVRVFFRERPSFLRALNLWSPARLAAALEEAVTAERACKTTGSADLAIARQTIQTLARRAAAARLRRG